MPSKILQVVDDPTDVTSKLEGASLDLFTETSIIAMPYVQLRDSANKSHKLIPTDWDFPQIHGTPHQSHPSAKTPAKISRYFLSTSSNPETVVQSISINPTV